MEPSNDLRLGRRLLEGIEGYELLEDLVWDNDSSHWYFKFRLTGKYNETDHVPLITDWYCFVSDNYPLGKIEINPSSIGGIKSTFPHMNYNKDISKPWRKGNICVKTNYGLWGEAFFNSEPFDNFRLEWAIYRSIAWIHAAAENRLFAPGEPFEFPDMPNKNPIPTLGFLESEKSFKFWASTTLKNGKVRIKKFEKNNRLIGLFGFYEKSNLHVYEWGNVLEGIKDEKAFSDELWYLLPSIPVLFPWQVPQTWEELFSCCLEMGVDLDRWLRSQLIENKLFNKVEKLLLGFPIPDRINSDNIRIHWFCIKLPVSKNKLKGFREGSKLQYQTMLKIEMNPKKKIQWMHTENLAKDQLTTRGNVSQDLQSKKILIIGCGAIGSQISELLVRLGCSQLTLVDDDIFSPGNSSRHTLTLDNVNYFKSEELAKRLNSIFPTSRINYETLKFRDVIEKQSNFMDDFDMILDLTAEDEVFQYSTELLDKKDSLFISLSLGLNATRLFCYFDKLPGKESISSFKNKLSPWIQKQKEENPNLEFPLEGIGCWHPIFPARLDDILGLLAPVIRIIENFLQGGEDQQFIVIERQQSGEIKIIDND